MKSWAQLGRELLDAREDYEKKHRIKVDAEKKRDRLQEELIERLRKEKLDGIPIDLGPGYGKVQFTRMKTIRGKVFDVGAAVRALGARKETEGFMETKPRQKPINDLVKECLETGQPIPDGIEFTEQPYIRVTRRKK